MSTKFRQNLAIVVGINDYHNGVPILKTPVSDAETVANILQTQHGYKTYLILNQQAKRAALIELLERTLPKLAAANDRLLFYFAGHGIALNGEEGPEGYLIPQDARLGDVSTYLPMSQVHHALLQLPCRHFLGILDCCFAGAFRWSSTRKLVAVDLGTIYRERFDRFIQDPAWQVITSAAYDQTALDAFNLQGERGQVGNHSPFAAALIEALEGRADAYPPAEPGKPAGDGVITATELYLYLRDRIEPATDVRALRQTPGIHPLQKHDKGEYIFLSPGHVLNLPPAPPLDASKNPYRGLQSFEEEHQELFFGRKGLTETLSEFFMQHPLTVVLGASGSGKSSLVKAGLIPHLRQHQNSQSWLILPPLRPGESPLKALAKTLTVIRPSVAPSNSAPDSTHALVNHLALWFENHPQNHLVLVVDQMEELITLCQDQQERQQFLEILATALSTYSERFHLLLTLRSDFEPQFRNTPLEPYWTESRFVVPAMSREELREAIESPAAARVIFFDPHPLVDQLIDEVANMPGALPLLSFALSELYLKYLQRQDQAKLRGETIDRSITQADYDELGGVTRSLTQRADQEYMALVSQDPACAQTIRNVMLRMVAVGGELARRRVPESEFKYPEPEHGRVQKVLRQLLAARLIVTGTDVNQQTYFEPAHDALVRGWDKLLTWQKEQKETLILQRRLTPAAIEWESVKSKHDEQPKGVLKRTDVALNWVDRRLFTVENLVSQLTAQTVRLFRRSQSQQANLRDQPNQFLWNANPYLDVLKQELSSSDHWLNQIESEFVQQSVLQKRRNLSWRWRITIAVILGLSGLTIAALIGQRNSLISQIQASRESAEARFRVDQSLNGFLDSLRAARSLQQPLLQIPGFKPDPELTQQVEGTLQKAIYTIPERNRLSAHQGTTRSQTSRDGRLIVTTGQEGNISIWNWQGQKQAEWASGQDHLMNLSFSPDSQQLATAGADGTVRLWTVQGQPLALLQGHTGMVKGISFSPDGQKLATSGADKTVRLWTIQGQSLAVLTGHRDHVWSVVFSPDGQMLASAADDGTFRLWNLQGKQLQQFSAQQGELHTLQFSPDGQRLATAGEDGSVRLWTLQGQPVATLSGHQGRVWRVEFSPDGQQLGSVAGDGTVRLWTAAGQPLAVLRGHQGPVRHVSFSPDSQRLVSSGDDATARFWDLQGQQMVTLQGHQGSVRAIAFNPNGQLATSGEDGTIRQWNLQGQPLTIAKGNSGAVRAIAFSPNGQQLASAQGETIRLWAGSDQPQAEFQGHQKLIRSVQFSPDGQRLVSAGDDGSMHLWNLQGQTLAKWAADQQRVWQVAFSPDGQQLASAGGEGIVRLWNLQGQLLGSFQGHLGPVYSVVFSPDGQKLASVGQDGTIRLWQIQDNRQLNLFQVFEVEMNSVAFSPDGQRLISGDRLGNVQVWNLQIQQQALAWSAHPNAIVRQVSFSPDGTLVATAADDGTAKVWRLDKLNQLRARSCSLIGDYLKYLQQKQQQISTDDRHLCDN